MRRPITTTEFIERCITKHGNAFDYSKTKYTNQRTKITITCPTHGDWECLPNNHSYLGQCCPICSRANGSYNRTTPFEVFVSRARSIHGDKYTYICESYSTTQSKTKIICPTHGEFQMTPNAHVSGQQGCPRCANRNKTNQQWIDEFVTMHGDAYDYSNVVVAKADEKITIMCRKHGEFTQTPSMHRAGQGCPLCAYSNHKGKYSHYYFEHHPDQRDVPATLYVLECTNAAEHFIKVGITTTSVASRIRNNRTTAYNIRTLDEYHMPLCDAFEMEQTILDSFTEFAYTPGERFQGRTECLLPSCYHDIINFIKEKSNVKTSI